MFEDENTAFPGISQPRRRRYIIHKVNPKEDTIEKLTNKYNVSRRDIQRANQFNGEDLFFYKEVLVPLDNSVQIIKGQKPGMTEEEQQEKLIKRLASEIKREEIKYAASQTKFGILKDSTLPSTDFSSEARYFLSNNDFDYDKALQEYHHDFEGEK